MVLWSVHPSACRHESSTYSLKLGIFEYPFGAPFDVDFVACVDKCFGRGGSYWSVLVELA